MSEKPKPVKYRLVKCGNKKLLNSAQKKSDFYLLLEWLVLAMCVCIGSWFHADGFLSSDSVNYLALANSLIEGNGFYVSGYGYSGKEKDFFAIWPMGYPLLIAFIAKLSGLSVFWSSKIVNILLAGLSLLIFRKVFSATAHIYGMLFLFGAAIVIYTFTWSESLFIFAMMGYTTAMACILKNSEHWMACTGFMLLFSVLLFLARYIGAFTIISTGVLALYAVLKLHDHKKGVALLIVAGINAILVIAYLYNNLTLTNHLTGIPRIAATESHTELLQQLLIAVISEWLVTIPYLFFRPEFLVIIIIQLLCFLFFFRKKPNARISQPRQYCVFSISFLSIGVFYLACLITLRWITHFDAFFFRLLFPGSLLIFTAIIRHLEINHAERFSQLAKTLSVLTVLTVMLILIEIVGSSHRTYKENISAIEQEYSVVASGSVVAFGSMHVKYLRDDILLWSPWSPPYNDTKESWENFLNRVGKNRQVYLAWPEDDLVKRNYDKSVMQVLEKQKGKGVTRIQ